jgi:hypothetical protein
MLKSHVRLMGSSHTVLRSALPRSVDQQSAPVNGAVSQWETIPPGEGSLQPVAIVSTRGDDEEKALFIDSTPRAMRNADIENKRGEEQAGRSSAIP